MKIILFLFVFILGPFYSLSFAEITQQQAIDIAKKALLDKNFQDIVNQDVPEVSSSRDLRGNDEWKVSFKSLKYNNGIVYVFVSSDTGGVDFLNIRSDEFTGCVPNINCISNPSKEQAVDIAKKILIEKNFQDLVDQNNFQINYTQGITRNLWDINFVSKKSDTGVLSIEINSATGEVDQLMIKLNIPSLCGPHVNCAPQTPKISSEQAIVIAKKYLVDKYHYSNDFSGQNITINSAEAKNVSSVIRQEHLTNANTVNDQWVVDVRPKTGMGGGTVYVDNQTGDVDGLLWVE